MTGSLAPPPPYGSEAGSILLEQGGGGQQGQSGIEGWQHFQHPQHRPYEHGRRRTAMYRPRAGTGPPVPQHPPPPNSPGPERSPTEISLAQLAHVDSNHGYGAGEEEDEDIGEGTSRQVAEHQHQDPVNLMDQRDVMPFGIPQEHHQPQCQFPQQEQQPIIPRQEPDASEDQPPEYTSPEGSFRRRDSDETISEDGQGDESGHQRGDDDDRRRLIDRDDESDEGEHTPPVPSYEAATAGNHRRSSPSPSDRRHP